MMNTKGERIRFPAAAGLFYPEEREEILKALASFGLARQDSREVKQSAPALALLVPHCSWNLSGQAAAEAFNVSRGYSDTVNRVVILGTDHDPAGNTLALSASGYFTTPLGKIKVDQETNKELASCSTFFEINDIPHLQEFSIEILLPFVQYCFPKASIVPVLMGRSIPGLVKGLASALNVVFEEKCDTTIFVISTCLAKHTEKEKALSQADRFVTLILEGKAQDIEKEFSLGHISGCGAPLAAAFLGSGLAEGKQRQLLPSGIQCLSEEESHICCGAVVIR